MRAPNAHELLGVWERCAAAAPVRRSVELVALARPELDLAQVESLTVGEADAALLDLREAIYGPDLESTSACEACGAELEFSLRVDDVRGDPAAADDAAPHAAGGYTFRFRVPILADLLAAADATDLDEAVAIIRDRCVIEVKCEGQPVSDVPAEVLDVLGAAAAGADPEADPELRLDCPSCGHSWSAPLDVAAFLWAEIEAWVRGTVREVHELASVYGWTEAEVFALGPRRRLYLELVGG